MFPQELDKYINGLKFIEDNIGLSKDSIYNFENKYILKISKDKNHLENEMIKTDWITSQLKGPKSILFFEKDNLYYYLRECVNGYNLIDERFISNPTLLLSTIKTVIDNLRTLDNKNCPFKANSSAGNSFIHGDLCLPNIYVDENNHFLSFIDVSESGLGDNLYDYYWLIWSFEYNLKTSEYTNELLKILNIKEIDKTKYKEYVLKAFEE